jgi:hypothetical protein
MMPFPNVASIQKSHVRLCQPRWHCVHTERSLSIRNCGSEQLEISKVFPGAPLSLDARNSVLRPESADILPCLRRSAG